MVVCSKEQLEVYERVKQVLKVDHQIDIDVSTIAAVLRVHARELYEGPR